VYLVDTNILSVSAPTKAVPQPALRDWMGRNSHALFLSVITVAEIEDGICRSRRTGARAKAARLAEWLDTLLHLYADRVLPIDRAIARQIGILTDRARHARLHGPHPQPPAFRAPRRPGDRSARTPAGVGRPGRCPGPAGAGGPRPPAVPVMVVLATCKEFPYQEA
jgi:predicted nucleic acid-binding protein